MPTTLHLVGVLQRDRLTSWSSRTPSDRGRSKEQMPDQQPQRMAMEAEESPSNRASEALLPFPICYVV